MGKSGKAKRLPVSSIVAVLIVIAAGGITWYGLSAGDGPAAASSVPLPAITLPADETVSAAPASLPSALPGGLPTRIVAPSAGIDAPISEVGVVVQDGRPSWETAWQAVGHHMDSARPGQPGNMVLTGHVSVADPGNVPTFKALRNLKPGDIIEVHSGNEVYRYSVTGVAVVSPSETRLLRSDHTSRITLITCTKDLKQRLVVVGMLV